MQGRRKVWKNGGPGGHSIPIFCPFLTSYYLPLNGHEKGFLLLRKKSGGTIAPLPPIPTVLKWEREKERQRELTWPRAASLLIDDHFRKVNVYVHVEGPQLRFWLLTSSTYIRDVTKFGIKVLWRLQFLEYMRTLSLKFQKAWTQDNFNFGLSLLKFWM